MVPTLLLAAFMSVPVGSGPDLRQTDVVETSSEKYVRVEGRASVFAFSAKHEPSLALGPGGQFAVAWESRRQYGGRSGVLVRSFDSYGYPLENERALGASTQYAQSRPAATYWSGKRPTAVFETMFRDGSGRGVFADQHQVNETVRGDQHQIVTASAEDGSTVVAWVSQVSRTESRVFARVYGSHGLPVTNEFRVSAANSGIETVPSIAILGDRIVVVWQRFENDASLGGLYAQLIDFEGRRVGDSRKIANDSAIEPNITACGNGFVIGWVESSTNGNFKVISQRLSSRLEIVSERQAAPSQNGSQNAIAVSGRRDGTYLMAWNLYHQGKTSIYLQLISAQNKPSDVFILTKSRSGNQSLAEATGRQRVAYREDGSIVAAWTGDSELGDKSSANYTLLIPKSQVSRDVLLDLEAVSSKSLSVLASTSKPTFQNGEVKVTVVHDVASPHEPPTFDPKLREDPWGDYGDILSNFGFLGIVSTGWTPPDPHMAAGPNHLVGIVNGAIAFFHKNGTKFFQQPIEDSFGFWGSVGATGFVFDPEVLYDPVSGRFFAMAAEGYAPGNRSYVLIAVSDDSNPDGTWYKYRIDTTGLAGNLFDSPNIGVDENVVYVTGDGFGAGSNYPVYTFDKASMLAGNAISIQRSTTLSTTTQSAGIPPVMTGVNNAFYMIEHQEATNNTQVRLIALRNALTSPTFTTFQLTVPAYGRPENPPSSGTSARPTTFDARFWSVAYKNGRLWATHHINSDRVLARWYEINMNGWPNSGQNPSLVQSGNIDPGATIRTFFSSIHVNDSGHAAVVCSRSSPTELISIFRAVRKPGDPLGTMPHTEIVKTNVGPFSGSRWGDYSACVVDPMDGTFWGHHEWSENGAWRTWLFNFAAPVTVVGYPPSSFDVTHGFHASGGLAELRASDDLYLKIDQRPPFAVVDPSARLVVRANVANNPWTELRFKLEARSNAVPLSRVRQVIELRNFQTGQWVTFDERNPSGSDSVVEVVTNNPSAYVQAGTGLVEARVSWFDLGTASPNWSVWVDQTFWNLTH